MHTPTETTSRTVLQGGSLEAFFHPRNVAVIGASESIGSVGRSLISNLREGGFTGGVCAVNPRHASVLGKPCYPTIGAIAEPIDLAVIATAAPEVPGIVRECAAAGVPAAVIVSAGFRECGAGGLALEREIRETTLGKMRIVGPNCLGLMNPRLGLNATFATGIARPGHIAFLSQSGALCSAILGWSLREMVGFSAFVSVGEMIDVGWGDLIRYFGDDPHTRSIVMYMESVENARSFLSAAREVALSKPIIVIKPGRTEAGARAAASHTGALAGQDAVFDAAFQRCGILRVNTIAELFYLAEALDKQPRPHGPRLTIVTNAGGPAVLAADALLSAGGCLAELSSHTVGALNRTLPEQWSHHNPVDILGDADPARYASAVDLAAKDPSTDGLLVILTPQGMTDPTAVATQLAHDHFSGKPLLTSWMGGAEMEAAEVILNRAHIPSYAWPDAAARVFASMWQYDANIKALYETPESFEAEDPEAGVQAPARSTAGASLAGIHASGRTLLTEAESKEILAAYGIPIITTEVAANAEDAVLTARRLGYPVVLKLNSTTITHKTDVGGVRLSLRDDESVRQAYAEIEASVALAVGVGHFEGVTVQPMVNLQGYELIVGSISDPQFGPVLLFGTGGQLVEIWKDRALGLPPLNTTLARRMIERTQIARALGGIRGRQPVDISALERLLVRFSYLVMEQRLIREIDINPLLASPDGLLALDARIVLHSASDTSPEPAIRPYPNHYAGPWRLADGTDILIRPIRPEDEPLIAKFHAALSEASVQQRYFHSLRLDQRVSHGRLIRVCFSDYDREIALVAERRDSDGGRSILAVGRLCKTALAGETELAVLIADPWQGKGLGLEMSRRIVEVAKAENADTVIVDILVANHRMIEVCESLGFQLSPPEAGVIRGILHLPAVARCVKSRAD